MIKKEIKMGIKEELIEYIKYKDVFKKEILDLEVESNKIIIKTKKGIKEYILMKDFYVPGKTENITYYVLLYTAENINKLIKNWDEISNLGLNIYFMITTGNFKKKTILNPHSHNKISEKKTLRQGICSLLDYNN